MDQIRTLVAKAVVVLKALPTYLAIAITVLTIFREEIVEMFPEGAAGTVSGIIATTLLWLGAVIAAIRRLMPALPGTEGLLTPDNVSLSLEAREADTMRLIATRDDHPVE